MRPRPAGRLAFCNVLNVALVAKASERRTLAPDLWKEKGMPLSVKMSLRGIFGASPVSAAHRSLVTRKKD